MFRVSDHFNVSYLYKKSPSSINFPVFLPPWRPRFLGSDSLVGFCWMPAEPGDVSGHTSPHQNAVSAGLATWPCRQGFVLARLFLSCASQMRSQTTLSPLLSPLPPSPSCACISISLHCLFTLSPNSHSSRVRGNGPGEHMFTSCSLWLSRYTVLHWSVAHFLVLIVQDVWGLRSVPCCSSLLMLVKVSLDSPKCDGGKYRKVPMISGIFQWNDHRIKPKDLVDITSVTVKAVKIKRDVFMW